MPEPSVLGPAGTKYEYQKERESTARAFKHIIGAVWAVQDLNWPRTAEEALQFASKLKRFAKAARVDPDRGKPGESFGLTGGMDKKSEYMVCHFVRAMLLHAEKLCPGLVDSVRFQDLAEFLPGQLCFCSPLEQLTGTAIWQQVGCSPLIVSAWTCLTHRIPKHSQEQMLTMSDERLWRGVDEYELETHGAVICRS